MTDRDRLRILADQGDPIAIGQLYREAKRRGEAVVCASTDGQTLTVPPLSSGSAGSLCVDLWRESGGRMLHVLCSAYYPTVTVTVSTEAWAAHLQQRVDHLMTSLGLDTAQADDLTMLAMLATGIPRAEGESDAEYRARLVRHYAG